MPQRIINVERANGKFGFFRYADDILHEGVDSPMWPLRHIFSQIRALGCSFLVEEDISLDDEDMHDLDAIKFVKGCTSPVTRVKKKISFFCMPDKDIPFNTDFIRASNSITSDMTRFEDIAKHMDVNCLGYLYLNQDILPDGEVKAYVPEAVIIPISQRNPNLYVHSKGNFSSDVFGQPFSVEGSYFAQQNTTTWCCAHAALLVILNNLSASLGQSTTWNHRKINEHLSIDHQNKKAEDGLNTDEIMEILLNAGLSSDLISFEALMDRLSKKQERDVTKDQQDDLADIVIASSYYAIESGLPSVLCFNISEDDGHAMAVVGHSFEPTYWPQTLRSISNPALGLICLVILGLGIYLYKTTTSGLIVCYLG